MPTTIKKAKKVLENYRDFPTRLRNSQEDIIKTLRGPEIRRNIPIQNMSDEQVYCISRRLYKEAREVVEVSKQIKVSALERKVSAQLSLFDNRPAHWQY